MAIEIKVPDMGESVIEATVARWMKNEGDLVSAGEPVVELETDKVNVEVGAQQAGTIQQIVKQAGENVAVGDVLAIVSSEASAATNNAAPPDDQPGKEDGSAADPHISPAQPDTLPADAQVQPGSSVQRATPVAQRMAKDQGIDLSQVQPSGSGGRITKEDVQAFLQKSAGEAPPAGAAQPAAQTAPAPVAEPAPAPVPVAAPGPVQAGEGRETRKRMSRRRQTIARRLVEAQQTAALLTTFNEVDMSAVMNLRKRRRESFKERYGVDLGYMPFFIKSVIGALRAFPQVNAEIQGEEIVLKHYYDIGVAIGAEEGLVVPVIRDADRLSFAEIEKVIRELVTKSREGTLTLDDLRGGTFTITNGGVYGSLLSTPILNPPQVGILGMHAIKERPVVIDGEIVVRPMMYLALSYDHRIVDGREAVQFLVRVKELVEDPEALLFG